jgi:hypothetical protein
VYHIKMLWLKVQFRFYDLLFYGGRRMSAYADHKFWYVATALRDTRDMHNYLKEN